MASRAAAFGIFASAFGIFAGCDGAGGDARGGDDEATLAPGDATVEVAPPAREEKLATTSSDGDDLFPALDGDDLVWVRMSVDTSMLQPGQEAPDCMQCPWCGGCNFAVMHRNLVSGAEAVLSRGVGFNGPARVSEGRAAFVDSGYQVHVVDLDTGANHDLAGAPQSGRVVALRDGILWWFGYDSGNSQLIGVDLDSGERLASVPTYLAETWWSIGNLASNGRAAPVAVDGTRLMWCSWGNASVRVQTAGLAGDDVHDALNDGTRDHIRILLLADGSLVTESYVHASGCGEAACELAFTRFTLGSDGVASDDGAPLVADAQPTLYVAPVASGDRLLWVDKRDGAYALWGVDVAAGSEARRLTSEDAVVGVVSPPAFDGQRVVWPDLRDGHWRLMMRTWK